MAAASSPSRSVAKRVQHEKRQPEIRQRGRYLHEGTDPGVRGIGDGLERRFDRRQRAPEVGHHRRKRQVQVVGVRQAPDRDPVHPQHELVQVAAQALCRKKDEADDDGCHEGNGERCERSV